MDLLLGGLRKAVGLLLTGDSQVFRILWLSARVSAAAVSAAVLLGLPVAAILAQARFRGRQMLISLIYAGMGLPPVVAGLLVMLLLWRSGPLGEWELLFTPGSMVIAQTLIALPIVIGLTVSALRGLDPRFELQMRSLGASRWQLFLLLLREARAGILAAVLTAFGRVLAEVGAVMMVGGNIKGQTRVMTTAIVLESRMGNFDTALALGMILMLLSFVVSLLINRLQHRGEQT